ncbi:MAG: GGDEF domain-containing protein [Thermodesulfobacteriota bacterium]|nr:GGDEF domain-containing protein [Thermodesulfobacteriota bacterium]
MKEPKRKIIQKELHDVLEKDILSLDFVSAIAGDRYLTPSEKETYQHLKSRYGMKIYVYLLITLTHQNFSEENARSLWNGIIRHKNKVEKILDRPVGISVATMDYLSNVKSKIKKPSVISKNKLFQIAEIALIDGLTGLYDVSIFHARLEVEIKRYKRYRSKVSLFMLDIDDFKKTNDSYGHQEGDRVLFEVSALILKVSRDLDICVRYGGEEFAVILPHTNSHNAFKLAERIRQSVERCFRKDFKITISIGVATCPIHAKSTKALIKKADMALYRSKKNGKNKVSIYQ